jgi:predicted phage tail protein
MRVNVGTPDRWLRLIAGLVLIALPFFTGWALFANPVWNWVMVVIGAVLVATGVLRFCPAYCMLNLSTSKCDRK